MIREQRLSYLTCLCCFCEMPHSDIKLPKKGKCILEIRTREGNNVPHFHIIGVSKKFYCAVCLNKAKYFKHGKWVDELNNEQKEKLQSILLEKEEDGMTKWESMVDHWNNSHFDAKDKVDKDNMPDYTELQ